MRTKDLIDLLEALDGNGITLDDLDLALEIAREEGFLTDYDENEEDEEGF